MRLVDRVFESPEALLPGVHEIARTIASKSPQPLSSLPLPCPQRAKREPGRSFAIDRALTRG